MRVYFDNAASTRPDERVVKAMLPYLNEYFGNASSVHSFGNKVKAALENARETIAETINAEPSEIYFTSGGTESDNFAVRMISKTVFEETGKNEIIVSAAEHQAVLSSAAYLSNFGFKILHSEITPNGNADLNYLRDNINDSTALISIMHANNETGALNDLNSIARLKNGSEIIIHSDCVQSYGKTPINLKDAEIDSISASSHKIFGPKGAGFLFVRNGTPINPLLLGGAQERNRRGGTENIPAIIGFAEAAKIIHSEMEENFGKVSEIKNKLLNGILEIDGEGITENAKENSSPYILSLTFAPERYKTDAESMLMFLDINGVAVSSGAACSSGTIKPSHVVLSMGKTEKEASGTIRFSFSPRNTIAEVDYALSIMKKFIQKFGK